MSPDERSLVRSLFVVPGGKPLSNEQFLRAFGAADGVVLGLDLLADAVDRHDPVDVELALVVGFTFGFSDSHLHSLVSLAFADWHQRHEDVASALGKLSSPASVDALVHLAQWIPSYLEYDEARALAVKAIWALGGIGEAADRALTSIAGSPCAVLAEAAVAQLQK